MLSKEKLLLEKVESELNPFFDSYVMEFLDLPTGFLDKDLRKEPIGQMKQSRLVCEHICNDADPEIALYKY